MISEIIRSILSEVTLSIIAIVIVFLLWGIELAIFKKFEFWSVGAVIGIVICIFLFPPYHIVLKILYPISLWCVLGYSIYAFVTAYQKYIAYDKELNHFLKNNEFDFFIQTDKKDRILGYSNKLLKVTKLPHRDIRGTHCWKLLLDYLKVVRINKKEVSLATISEFLNAMKEANSKHVIYQLELEMPKLETLTEENSASLKGGITKYTVLIQPVYHQKKLIGRNIYFYQDRMQVLHDLRSALKQATFDLETAHNFVYIMMSLMDYVGLYFDYNTRTYVATEAFVKFENNHQKEYTFNQFMDMMHPDDVDNYVEQASTINSISVTKLKYRLLINDDYYYVMEDSININKDADLVSVIRILNKVNEEKEVDTPLSTKEVDAILDSLSTSDITEIMNKTERILNTVVGKDEKEN